MGMVINTNVDALNALRNLGVTQSAFSVSVQRLSSGLRINNASDDAAGLAISNKLNAQVTGLNQAQRNAQDGVSMIQTADGALNEIDSMLVRIRELGVEAANGTVGTSEAASINTEVQALQQEITRIAGATKFNGQALLTGALTVSQSGGTVGAGYVVVAGTNTSVTNVSVAGAKAGTTFSLTDNGSGKLSLADGNGNSQQVTVGTLAGPGSEILTFDRLGVSIAVATTNAGGETGANIATGLAAGPGSIVTAIGGASGTDLVNGDVLSGTSTTPVVAGGVGYDPLWGLDDSGGLTPMTATASPGVAQGTLNLGMAFDTVTGAIAFSYGGESFTGHMAPIVNGDNSTVVCTGDRGNTITLHYKQGSAAILSFEALDTWGATFNFVAGGSTATASAMAATPTAVAGTYTFSSTAPGSLTLTRSGGTETIAIADTAASTTQHLVFGTLGISFDITADATLGGFSKEVAISNLMQPANDTIVVTSSVTPGAPGTVITRAGPAAQFQIGANSGDTMQVTFGGATASALGIATAAGAFNTAATGGNWSNLGAGAAANLISAVDNAIDALNTLDSTFGAVQNRLNHTIAAVGVASENLNASQSRIKDLDVAAEMVKFTKNQILAQAGTAILSQANSAPQSILTLLR